MGWAAHRDNLDQFATQLRQGGIEFEGPQPGLRQRPDGKPLRWKALRLKDESRGPLPIFIERSKEPLSPSAAAATGCTLQRFAATTVEAEDFLRLASRLQLD